MSDVRRIDPGPRLSEASVYGDRMYLSGMIPEDTSLDIAGQVKQALADRLFQLGDRLAERWLRHETGLGRPAEAVGLGHGDEVAELVHFHRCFLSTILEGSISIIASPFLVSNHRPASLQNPPETVP